MNLHTIERLDDSLPKNAQLIELDVTDVEEPITIDPDTIFQYAMRSRS